MRLFVVCVKNMMGILQIQVKQLFNIKTSDKKNSARGLSLNYADRDRTYDLQVMSLAS